MSKEKEEIKKGKNNYYNTNNSSIYNHTYTRYFKDYNNSQRLF